MARFRRITRGPQLQKKLTRLRKGSDPAAQAGLLRAGEIVSTEQKRLAPVDDGDLRDSIEYELTRSARTGNQAVKIFTSLYYARFVEDGTASANVAPVEAEALQIGANTFVESATKPRIGARPFFRPGYRASRRRARAAIAKAIRDDIVKAAK